jgi:sulfate-transporting ATPase
MLSTGALPSLIFNHFGSFDNWLAIIGGVLLILVLLLNQDGIVPEILRQWRAGRERLARTVLRRHGTSLLDADVVSPIAPSEVGSNGSVRAVTPSRSDGGRRGSDHTQALEVRGLTVRFGGVVAVSQFDLSISAGEIIGLIGSNGAGKTTLIDAIAGYVRPAEGSITLSGVNLDSLSAHRRARMGVIRSFQSMELFDDLSVLENLQVASDPRDGRAYLTNFFGVGLKRHLPPVANTVIDEFSLEPILHLYPTELPHGARRLVGIARAIAASPSILLLDEPAAGLSESERTELKRLVRRLADDWGLGILLVEHDVDLVMGVCDRVVVIEFGAKIADGLPEIVRNDARVVTSFLGSS